MQTSQFLDHYFTDALRIHAICADLKLATKEAKLLTYIHVKALQAAAGIAYFDSDLSHEIAAIRIMLGDFDRNLDDFQEAPPQNTSAKLPIAQHVNRIDSRAYRRFGLEFPLKYELMYRLDFLRNDRLRRDVLTRYQEVILPRVFEYSFYDSLNVFRQQRAQVEALVSRLP